MSRAVSAVLKSFSKKFIAIFVAFVFAFSMIPTSYAAESMDAEDASQAVVMNPEKSAYSDNTATEEEVDCLSGTQDQDLSLSNQSALQDGNLLSDASIRPQSSSAQNLTPQDVTVTPGWESVGTCEWKIENEVLTIRPANNGTYGELPSLGFATTSGMYSGYYKEDNEWPWTTARWETTNFVREIRIEGHVKAGESLQGIFGGAVTIDSRTAMGECENIVGLENLDTSSTTDMSWMFHGCESLHNLDLSKLDTSLVKDMSGMLSGCIFDSLDLSMLDTSNVIDMSYMFAETDLSTLDFSKLNTRKVEKMSYMFMGVYTDKLDLSGFSTQNVTDMRGMFVARAGDCSMASEMNLSGFNTSKVSDMSYMFSGCSELKMLDLSSFDTHSVTTMHSMFARCMNLEELNISSFNTSSVQDMRGMFGAEYDVPGPNIKNLDLSHFDTSNVKDMGFMFRGARGIESLDLSSFDTSKVEDSTSFFFDNYFPITYKQIKIGQKFTLQEEFPDMTWYNAQGASFTPKTIPRGVADTYAVSMDYFGGLGDGKVSLSSAIIIIPEQSYTGAAVTPKPIVKVGNSILQEGNDYIVSYSNNISVGNATMTITGRGQYQGSVIKSFAIKVKDLSSGGVSFASIPAQTFKGSSIMPGVTVTYNGRKLVYGVDYTLYYTDCFNAGTAKVTAYGRGNYTGTLQTTFKINSLSLAQASVTGVADKAFTGKPITQNVVVKLNGVTLKQTKDYDLLYSNNTNVGKATVTVVGKGNYAGSKISNFNITPSFANSSITSSQMIRNATGAALEPAVTVKLNSKTLVKGTDYYLTYNGKTDLPKVAGNYVVRAVGKGSYVGTKDVGTFKLLQGPVNGQVEIASMANNSYVLDASGSTPKKGANVSIWSDNGGSNQKWNLVLGTDGYYTIRSSANMYYQLDASGSSPKKGSNVSIWSSNNGYNQKWIIEPSGSSYIVRSAANPDLVLDAAGSTPKRGANVSVWTSNGGNNQKWKIAAVSKPSFDKNKVYQISSRSNSKFVLDAAGSNPRRGANVSIWTSNNGKNQEWYLIPDGKGYYYIKSYSNQDFMLDAAGRYPKRGSNVSVWTSNNGNNQKWKIEQLADGSYLIRSAANQNYVLDASGATPIRGANVSVWSTNGGNNQKWNIKEL